MKIQQKLLQGFLFISVIILIAGILGIIEIKLIHTQSKNIGMINAPLADAVMEVKLTATTAHLWFEEILTGTEEQMVIAKVWKLLDESIWYCDAIINGGRNLEGHFYPVNDQAIEQKILSVKADLKEFQQMAKLRFENHFGNKQLEDQSLDVQFDALFEQFIQKADNAETLIQTKITQEAEHIDKTVTNSLLILGFATLLSFIVSIGLGIKIARTLSIPIQEAALLACQVAQGNFSQPVAKKERKIYKIKEINDLFKALAKMMIDIQALITETVKQKDEALRIKDETLRINQALEKVKTNVLIANKDYQIIYANQAAQQLFQVQQANIQSDLPNFEAEHLLKYALGVFYQNPKTLYERIEALTTTHHTTLNLGILKLDLTITPVINAEKQRLGWIAEFYDRTTEIATELEVNKVVEAASIGDFKQRITIADKTGFFQTFSEGLNKTLDYNQQIIAELQHVFAAIAAGDLTQTITKDYAGSLEQLKNDVNAMLNKLQVVMETLQQVTEAASQGNFVKSIDITEQKGFFANLSGQLNQLFASNQQMIEELRQVFAAIAIGDLTQTMTREYAGILEQLQNDVNVSIAKLTQVINIVQRSASVINQATQEMVQGNTSLSQRTEQQAASLEETVASMEEMTSTVQQNAENAQQANHLATTARDYANNGGNVVEMAIIAMTEINQSSQKVADIIGVIDEIAFQTNLLALNAAVEAARAGEQGRGFAVVAAEVRNLAQRSAEAAKEIKGLIKDSVKKVEEGSSLVNQSGETLAEIVTATKKVSDIVGEIAAANREQSAGIQQINNVISQLDEMTQQNSALVEEAATTSETLKEQVQNLNEQMAFFKTDLNLATDLNSINRIKTKSSNFKFPIHSPTHPPPHQDKEWKEF
jgi:methyl-accepting chemotaxis protein